MKYAELEMEIIRFSETDVITTSLGEGGDEE
jgi:hypothetical protein